MKRRLFLAGDSTACAWGPDRWPQAGWGMALASHAAPGVEVVNLALSGRSSKSFVDEGHWASLVSQLEPGDGVLIQFGHNDEKSDEARHTDPATTFPGHLANMVADVRAAGALPFLLTPVERRHFDGPRLLDTHGAWSAAIRSVAPRLGVPLLDVGAVTHALLELLGPSASQGLFLHLEPGVYLNYPEGCHDDTHLNPVGAATVAWQVVRLLLDHESGRGFLPGGP